ncbi:MAG: DMT family transporter [Gulosibacter sp.]|uniref:DMT family transporter n=1 Tax=Gulosibacter sp. TaxID=2817531 RepID=UPI003F922176
MTTSIQPSQAGPFRVFDWILMLGAGTMWGSSFFFVRHAIEDIDPTTVAWLRLVIGALVLTIVPASWRPLHQRRDWWLIAILAFVWMAVPFTLLNFAQQSIDSAMAGMINGSAPLFTAIVAALWFRKRPSKLLAAGLIVGFLGIIVVLMPSLTGNVRITGVLLMLLVTAMYGVAFNISGNLQQRNGALAVIWRAQVLAAVMTTPLGLLGLGNTPPATFSPSSIAAVAALGLLSTGLAFICFTVLIGRVGPARASINIYLIPVVAMLLGALVAGEQLHPISFLGVALVLLGAFLASRSGRTKR